jgi:hypothetical protein
MSPLTVENSVGVGSVNATEGGSFANDALTDLAVLMKTRHSLGVGFEEQPVQPVKRHPRSGAAVKSTD